MWLFFLGINKENRKRVRDTGMLQSACFLYCSQAQILCKARTVQKEIELYLDHEELFGAPLLNDDVSRSQVAANCSGNRRSFLWGDVSWIWVQEIRSVCLTFCQDSKGVDESKRACEILRSKVSFYCCFCMTALGPTHNESSLSAGHVNEWKRAWINERETSFSKIRSSFIFSSLGDGLAFWIIVDTEEE